MYGTACPSCGGTTATELAPGRYRCDAEIEYLTEVLVDDPMSRLAYGTPGMRPQREVRRRPCAHEFEVPVPHSSQVCTGTRGHVPCGAFAVGECQECGHPVCTRHGSYFQDRLSCAACQHARAELREQTRIESEAHQARQKEQEAATAAAAAIADLAAAPNPADVLAVLRELRTRYGGNPWADHSQRPQLEAHILAAWARYINAHAADADFEVVVFRDYQVGRRPSGTGVGRREPCFISNLRTQRSTYMGEDVTVDDMWAFSAHTAHHVGEGKSHPNWRRFGGGPVLSGAHVVTRGRTPTAVTSSGYKRLSCACWPVLDSRPLTTDDVLEVVRLGHRPDSRRNTYGESRIPLT